MVLQGHGVARENAILPIAAIFVGLAVTAAIGSPSAQNDHASRYNNACRVARSYLNEASQFSNTYDYRKAYDTALVGLRANQRCKDARLFIVNEGYLLSTKAIAEHFIKKGDSAGDLNRAIDLLKRCRDMGPTLGRTVSEFCRKQEQNDIVTRERFETLQVILK